MLNGLAKRIPFPNMQLRRITTSGAYIAEIDGLRFVAILSVILFHIPVQINLRSSAMSRTNLLWHLISHGDRGVQLFFVISGFILCMPFAKQYLSDTGKIVRLSDYYLRRLTRLEPPYLLANLARVPLLIVVMHKPLQKVLLHGLATIFYVHSAIFGTGSYVNPPSWSLEVEIQFYCLAPLLAGAYFAIPGKFLRRATTLGLILIAGAAQIAFVSPTSTPRLALSIVNYIQYFLVGFVLCDLYLTDWEKLPRHYLWDVASALLWVWIFAANGEIVHLLLPIATRLAYIGAFKGVLFRAFFRTPFVCLTGGMCYSIYLTHNATITGVDLLLRRFGHFNGAVSWPHVLLVYCVAVPLTLLVGMGLFIFVERPCMDRRWPRNLWNRLNGAEFNLEPATAGENVEN